MDALDFARPSTPTNFPLPLGSDGSMLVEATTPPLSTMRRRSVPYPYQVGGHGQLRQVTPGRLLKPVYDKELKFYNYIHSPALPTDLHWLRHATPAYYGEQLVSSSESEGEQLYLPSSSGADDAALPLQPPAPYLSPWTVTMGRRAKSKRSKTRPGAAISLEDVNAPFSRPCVLDVKMGTRQYDDDASEAKRRRHIAKSAATTSKQYGMRFTGMQTYKDGAFTFRDKYHGRRLRGPDLGPELRWFFHNGEHLRAECIHIVLNKLERIQRRLKEQRHFKFYSSSLLLIYEGDIDAPPRADVRMIDFAHTQWVEPQGDPGYLFGINTLQALLSRILSDYHANVPPSLPLSHIPADPEPTSV